MRILKKVFIHLRNTVKLVSLITLGVVLIIALIVLIYKPIYKVLTKDFEDSNYFLKH